MISSDEIKKNPLVVLKKQLSQALNHRDRNQSISIDLDRPFNLYLVKEQSSLYLDAIAEDLFVQQLYNPYFKALEKNISSIYNYQNKKIDFIDLGPGYPDKSAPILKHLIRLDSRIRYIPVDISKYFLDITIQYFKDWPIDLIPLNILFEELPRTLIKIGINKKEAIRVVNIGFTFNNFEPDNILNLLKSLNLGNTLIILATQIIDDTIIKETLKPYRSIKSDNFNFKMLELLGYDRKDFEYKVQYVNNRIEMGYWAIKDIISDDIGIIKKGDYIITSFSYRYDEKNMIKYLKKYFSEFNVISDKNTRICIVSLQEGLK